MSNKKQPKIVGFVSDLMMASKIEAVAQHVGFEMVWVETAVSISPTTLNREMYKPGEALHGLEGALFEKVTAWQPSLLLFDLTNDEVPWKRWIAVLKSSPATRRLPILCFGPHVATDKLQAAQTAGADLVVPRSKFAKTMPDLFKEQANIVDSDQYTQTCQEPLPELVMEGLTLFNQGEFYKCHDALEEAWIAESGPVRELYRGILQVGIAYFQIKRGNFRGGMKMLLRVRQWLAPFPDVCRTIHIEQLRNNVDAVQFHLTELGPDRISDFDKSLFKPIMYGQDK